MSIKVYRYTNHNVHGIQKDDKGNLLSLFFEVSVSNGYHKGFIWDKEWNQEPKIHYTKFADDHTKACMINDWEFREFWQLLES